NRLEFDRFKDCESGHTRDITVPERKLTRRRVQERRACVMVNSQPYSSAYAYRFPYRASYGYVILAIILLVMSWESTKTDAAVAGAAITEGSIRLRILANSDTPADQAVKRHVRDAVVADMARNAAEPQSIDEARRTIAD